ncbi:MAG: FAD-dependent oxidoreductase [Dehalogenimonas sp.]|jgi:NAD(P)H-nitrite reductase large subunit|uniref:FAD-dependent oxidoreductase n=1 Tax=Candidatus Dehalogenimonas loeffleri TaxID=3127115 RepID=A0ABZ2J3V5_9CHLR|nr:FAD-dependent oxidoreductase [Dehalogenimonas sp.]
MKTKYLIIGNSAGGIGAAEAIREIDPKGALTIVGEEPYAAYSRPLISKYVTGEYDPDGMRIRPAAFYDNKCIDLKLGHKAYKMDAAARTVTLDDGTEIGYEKLLLATGGKPIIPKMEGMGKAGIFNFINLADATKLEEYLPEARRAVVIGGGLIGISATEALIKRGLKVTVVEMKGYILNTILDEPAGRVAEMAVKKYGVNMMTGRTVARILGEDRVTGVVFDDGHEMVCDMVVVAVGVFPRVELAQAAGINVNRGIVVDNHMLTSLPNVYACGDASEAYDYVYGSGRLSPVWPNAYIGGRVAGYNMAGLPTPYRGGTAMNSLNYFGLELATAGMASPPSEEGYEVLVKKGEDVYQKLIINAEGKLVGMIFVGNIDKAGIYFGLMRDRAVVTDFKDKLLADDFGLALLPKAIIEERLTGATAGRVKVGES